MKTEIVIIGPIYPPAEARLEAEVIAHRLWEAPEQSAFAQRVADRMRGVAVYVLSPHIGSATDDTRRHRRSDRRQSAGAFCYAAVADAGSLKESI
jgi:hypothetical protein